MTFRSDFQKGLSGGIREGVMFFRIITRRIIVERIFDNDGSPFFIEEEKMLV